MDYFAVYIDPALNLLSAVVALLMVVWLAAMIVQMIVARRKHKTEELIFLVFSIAAAYAFARHAAYWFGVVTDLYPVNPVTWLRPINKYMFGYTAILAGGIARSVWFDLGRPMIWRKRSESD